LEAERKTGRYEDREGSREGEQERGIHDREGMRKARKEEDRERKARIDGGKISGRYINRQTDRLTDKQSIRESPGDRWGGGKDGSRAVD